MKRISLVALTTFAAVCSAQADISDPLRVIYRVAGLIDSTDVATVFLCSNFGSTTEKLKFTVKTEVAIPGKEINVQAHKTVMVATSNTDALAESLLLDTGIVDLGGAIIHSTDTQKVFCSALLQGKNDVGLEGVGLHMVRFNPATGVQEDPRGQAALQTIYRVPGAINDSEIVTMIQCTNFGATNESVRFVIHGPAGNTSETTPIAAGETVRAMTGATDEYSVDLLVDPGNVTRGGATILATSTDDIFCSAMLVNVEDAEGIALQMARVSPVAGTQE